MENMNQLWDLLRHEIKDLYSAEKQIIEALPKMIEKANNKLLKKTLQQHLDVTEKQRGRLDDVLEQLGEQGDEETSGVLGMFKGNEKCLGMEGLIKEGEKLMKEDMSPEVSDAAIIAAAQKIEHYEISSYGTARAFAQELNLSQVEYLLQQTLDEEYEADDLLTELEALVIHSEADTAIHWHLYAISLEIVIERTKVPVIGDLGSWVDGTHSSFFSLRFSSLTPAGVWSNSITSSL